MVYGHNLDLEPYWYDIASQDYLNQLYECIQNIGDVITERNMAVENAEADLSKLAMETDIRPIKTQLGVVYVKNCGGLTSGPTDVDHVRRNALQTGMCCICRHPFSTPGQLPCGHVFDVDCSLAALLRSKTCPLCAVMTEPHDLRVLKVTKQYRAFLKRLADRREEGE